MNAWALRNFDAWKAATNKKHPDKPVPEGVFVSSTTVCEWLCKFVLEMRQENGSPKLLYSILCGLYRISRSTGVDFNFLDKNNIVFRSHHRTLDSVFSDLHSNGVRAQSKSAKIISFDDEQMLWDKAIFSFDNPQTLQKLVFLCWTQMSLRGCQEHHGLKVEQFTRFPADKDEYTENTYGNLYPKTTNTATKICILTESFFDSGFFKMFGENTRYYFIYTAKRLRRPDYSIGLLQYRCRV